MTQMQKLSHSQHHHNKIQTQTNPNSSSSCSMWNPRSTSSEDQSMWDSNKSPPEDDDSWEVRAFAEDTRNVMGTTWPPRSYTCTFCRREFRSAQALGGHMNVHRRDRARLHQTHLPATASQFINIPTQELVANAGLCLLYHFPSPNNNNFSLPNANVNANGESAPSTLVSVSPYSTNNNMTMQSCTPTPSFGAASSGIINGTALSSYICNSSKVERELPATSAVDINSRHEELDLELRLGHKPRPT